MSQTRATGGAFRVGTALGIPIRIHFTFFLLLLWFGMASASTGEGFLTGVVFILLLFGCVVLHELGHVLSINRAVHPRWDIPPAEVPATARFPFFELSWTIDRKGDRYASSPCMSRYSS